MDKITYYDDQINLKKIIENESELISERGIVVCDLSDICRKYDLWKTALPRIKPFYAVKCNDDMKILKMLHQMGCGFDCASQSEIERVKLIDVPNEDIIFAHPYKIISHLKYAKQIEQKKMTVDSAHELVKIKKYFPDAELLLRFRCDAKKSLIPLGEKFGCEFDDKAPELLQLAKDLNLNVVGINFHVGSGCQEFEVYERAIKAAAYLFEIGRQIGLNINLLDIGGGFPGDSKSKFLEIANIINKALDEYFPNGSGIEIVAEPGRYFVKSAQTLLADIHSKREVCDINGRVEKVMYYLNDGLYGSMHWLLVEETNLDLELYEISENGIAIKIDINDTDNNQYRKSTIWGPSCLPHDCVIEDIKLPSLQIGTKFVVRNRGAYSLTIASGFNGFILPQIKFFMNSQDKINFININNY